MSKTLYLVMALLAGGLIAVAVIWATRAPKPAATAAAKRVSAIKAAGARIPPRPPVKADRADAKSVVLAFATALTTGDKATTSELSVGTPKQLEYLDAQVDDYDAFIRFDALLEQKFKDGAGFYLSGYDKLPDSVGKATIKAEGDTADASFYFEEGGTFMGWKLVKRDGQWSVDASSIWDPEAKPDDSPEKLRRHVDATNDLIRRLAAGRFRSVEATMEAWEEAHGKIDEAGE